MAKAKKKTNKKKLVKKPNQKKAKKAAPKSSSKKKAASKKPIKKTSSKKSAKKPVKKKVVKKTSSKKTSTAKAMKIHPLADRLVVRAAGASEKTAGGLYIPGTVQERPHQGEVLACGPGAKSKKGRLKPLDVKVGDQVLFGAYAGVTAEFEGQEVLILREDEVLGILS